MQQLNLLDGRLRASAGFPGAATAASAFLETWFANLKERQLLCGIPVSMSSYQADGHRISPREIFISNSISCRAGAQCQVVPFESDRNHRPQPPSVFSQAVEGPST